MAILPAPLETARFGVVCAKLDPSDSNARNVELLNQRARSEGVQLLTARIEVSDLTFVRQLEADGFGLMDTLVCYGRSTDGLQSAPPVSTDVKIRAGARDHAHEVEDIARTAFTNYFGHYHADPRLDNAAATEAYVEWAGEIARRQDQKETMLVALHNSQVVGFLAIKICSLQDTEITLNAVATRMQGMGTYSALLSESLALSKGHGARRVIVSTQINNYPVQRVWSRFGFVHERSFYTLHKWFD